MSRRWVVVGVFLVFVTICLPAMGGPFVLFPKAGQLVSPDGRFVVYSVEREAAASQFVGTFRALWLTELASGRSRKVCDYFGVAAVAWSSDNHLVISQYLGKKSSRALVIPATGTEDGVVLDVPTLVRSVPDLRLPLQENDHVFVEASRFEDDTLHLRVWGYGRHDPEGFRWRCEYGLQAGGLSCHEEPKK